mgnify:CR=1 FL=1
MDNIFTFQGKKVPEGMRAAKEGETGLPEVLQAFTEFKKMVDAGELEGFVLVGTLKDGETFATMAGLLSPIQMAGLLEAVKVQILLG